MRRNFASRVAQRRCGYCGKVIGAACCGNRICVAVAAWNASPSRKTRAEYRHRGGQFVYLREMASFLLSDLAAKTLTFNTIFGAWQMTKTATLAIPPNRSDSGPRFRARQSRETDGTLSVYIYDDDFGFDATLYLTGDFLHEDRIKYALAVVKALNAADIPVRTENETAGEPRG